MNRHMTRHNNFELLRIVSMLLIVSFHCVYYGGFSYSGTFTVAQWQLKEFWFFGELGVNLFILVSGYFMPSNRYRSEKVMKLVFQVYFYHILCCVLAWKFGMLSNHPIALLSKTLFPITRRTYWYVTVYLMIYIFSPYMKQMVHTLSQRDFARILIVCFTIWSVLPTISGWAIGVESDLYYYNRFLWCAFIYLLGAYIRLYSLPIIASKKGPILLAGISFLLASLAVPIIAYFSPLFGISIEPAYFWHPNTVLMLFMSIGVFGIATHIQIPDCKWISVLASTTLGIYLFHDGLLRQLIWEKIFDNARYQDSPLLIIFISISIFSVFLLGVVIDLIRQQFFVTIRKNRQLQAADAWIVQLIDRFLLKLYRIMGT